MPRRRGWAPTRPGARGPLPRLIPLDMRRRRPGAAVAAVVAFAVGAVLFVAVLQPLTYRLAG